MTVTIGFIILAMLVGVAIGAWVRKPMQQLHDTVELDHKWGI